MAEPPEKSLDKPLAEESEERSGSIPLPVPMPASETFLAIKRHQQEHFKTQETPSPKRSGGLSDEAIKWHAYHFLPFFSALRAAGPSKKTSLAIRSFLVDLFYQRNWEYFLEHLGDLSSEENVMIRSILREKFDLALLLTSLDEEQWSGLFAVLKTQPWFQEKMLRNAFDLESILPRLSKGKMKQLKDFKNEFSKTKDLSQDPLGLTLRELAEEERERFLFDQQGIDKLCKAIKNAEELAAFLKLLREEELSKFLDLAGREWVESILKNVEGVALCLKLLKNAKQPDFDRQEKFLDRMGGLEWLKDCIYFDRQRGILNLSALLSALTKAQQRKLLLNKIGLSSLAFITVDSYSMMVIISGLPEGIQEDLALIIISSSLQHGVYLIKDTKALVELLQIFPEERQANFLDKLVTLSGNHWLAAMLPDIYELASTLDSLSPQLQLTLLSRIEPEWLQTLGNNLTDIKELSLVLAKIPEPAIRKDLVTALLNPERLLAIAPTLNHENDLVLLWSSLPKDLSLTRLLTAIGPEKVQNLLAKISDEQKIELTHTLKSAHDFALVLHQFPTLIAHIDLTQLKNSARSGPELILLMHHLPKNEKNRFFDLILNSSAKDLVKNGTQVASLVSSLSEKAIVNCLSKNSAFLWSKIENTEQLIRFLPKIPLALRAEFILSSTGQKQFQELLVKEVSKPSLSAKANKPSTFFSSAPAKQTTASLHRLEDLLPKAEDKIKLKEVFHKVSLSTAPLAKSDKKK